MTIRWGIIGCGDVTEVKSGPAFSLVEGSELVAVMRRQGHLAQDYARRHGVPKWYDDAEALINDPDIDAIYIATPPGSHCELALHVCAAAKPAYVEKPMARNHAECRRMVDAFRGRGVKLFVAYYRRALPRFLKVRELIESGQLGEVTGTRYLYTRPPLERKGDELPWRLIPELSGGGLLLDVGSHALDLIDFLLGPLSDVQGVADRLGEGAGVEDRVAMSFRTARGAAGTALWDFTSFEHRDVLEITGTAGGIAFSVFGNNPLQLMTPAGLKTFDLPNPRHIQLPMIQSVVEELRGQGTCASTGESAARTSLVMDLVTREFYRGRDEGFWTRLAGH